MKGTDLFLLRITQRVPFIFVPGVGEERTESDVGAAALCEAFGVLLVEVDVPLPFTAIVDFIPDFCGGAGTATGEVPGDLIFGDVDGVLVIPAEHIEYVIEKALEKARGEKNVRKAIEKGMSATEAFATFGIL